MDDNFVYSSNISDSTKGTTQSVLFLFGWVGSNDRLLSKYASMLHNIGINHVYRITAKTWDIFINNNNIDQLADNALKKRIEKKNKSKGQEQKASNGFFMIFIIIYNITLLLLYLLI